MRLRERGRTQVLRRVRVVADDGMPIVRHAERPWREVLRRVRDGDHRQRSSVARDRRGNARPAERRLVSVLFADLVGFTTASEGRDAEETRELLSRYFDTARGIIERYGGTLEKFIGDAVMAVWGTPTATEDDAERAVRAALDLLTAIPELDAALQARAGVLTGEAAVTLGAEGQGMVAGDLVDTAARIQSAADPSTVLVGEATKRGVGGRHRVRRGRRARPQG